MKITCPHPDEAYIVLDFEMKYGQWVWRCDDCYRGYMMRKVLDEVF